jgi:hypothetical protein
MGKTLSREQESAHINEGTERSLAAPGPDQKAANFGVRWQRHRFGFHAAKAKGASRPPHSTALPPFGKTYA